MSDQFRKRWDNQRRRQQVLKTDYLEEIRCDTQRKRGVMSTGCENDADFRANHPREFAAARTARDKFFAWIDDPIIFLRESPGEPVFVFSPSDTLEDFCDLYGLNAKAKPTKQLYRRLEGYAAAIQKLLREMFREWPIEAFTRHRSPREYKFTNSLGLVASVWMFLSEPTYPIKPDQLALGATKD